MQKNHEPWKYIKEIRQSKKQKENSMKKNKKSLREMYTIKCTNICVMRVAEEEKKRQK